MKLTYLTLILLGSLLFSCNNSSRTAHETGQHDHNDQHAHAHNHLANDLKASSIKASLGELSDMSIYNLNSKWATQNGDSIELKSLGGKARIVAMIYTSCDYACPRTIADLKRIEESLSEQEKAATGIVLVTLDPERDNPEKLKEYALKKRLDQGRWISLTGEENNVMELAALLNVKYRKELSMDIAHSNIISVLNEEGELIHQQEGLGTDPSETVNAITALVKNL